jgi:hypothetical protein
MQRLKAKGSGVRNGRIMTVVTAGMAMFALGATQSSAATTPEACEALRVEQAQLVQAGVPQWMERGPEAARTTLDGTRLNLIKRYIEVSEQLTFRCDRLKPVNARIEQAETPDNPDAPAAQAVTPPPVAAPKAVPPVIERKPAAPKAASPATPAAPATAAIDPPPKPKPAPKTAPKPKANDAFVPPAGTPATTLDQQPAVRAPRPSP